MALARLARSGGNPYLELLEQSLRGHGFEIVPDPPFTIRWLWRSRRRVQFLHFHWRPDHYYTARLRWRRDGRPRSRIQRTLTWLTLARFAGRLLVSRALGYRVVWTIHEVLPPETGTRLAGSVSREADRIGERLLARSSHLLFAHDVAVAANARSELQCPGRRIEIVPHGSYVGVYPPGRSRAEVRAGLRLAEDAFVFLCFGSLRPEKEIPLLLTAFQALASPELVLVVAGNPEDPLASWSTLRAFRADARIRPILGKIPTAGVAELFGAADAAVIPRSENWTSGSLILALSLGVPPVASRLPVHEQLLDGERAGWLFRPGDADSLRDALDRAAGDPPTARAKGEAALRQAMSLPSWPAIAQQTMSLLLGGEAGTTATDADAGSGSAPRGGATIAAAQRRSWRA